jgi:hypothetical protein
MEEIDLFEHYDKLPKNVTDILDRYAEEDNTYPILEDLQAELEAVGYTFDYGLDAEPYNLRKIAKKGTNTNKVKKASNTVSKKEKEVYNYYVEQTEDAPSVVYADIERDVVKKYKLGSVQNLHKILNKFPLINDMETGGSLANTPESFPSNDAISYKTGGLISVGDKVKVLTTGKSMKVTNISKNKKGQIEFSGKDGSYLIGDLRKMETGGSLANTPESFPSNDAISYKTGGGVGYGRFKGAMSKYAHAISSYIDRTPKGITFFEMQRYLKREFPNKNFSKQTVYAISRTLYATGDYIIDDKKEWQNTNIKNKVPMQYANGGDIETEFVYNIGGLL